MRFLGYEISLKRRESTGWKLVKLAESQGAMAKVLQEQFNRLDDLSKKVEAVRRKVYRDLEGAPKGENPDFPGEPPLLGGKGDGPLPSFKTGEPWTH